MAYPASTGFGLEFTDPTTLVARQQYVAFLAQALRSQWAVPDPSYALAKDINAYELIRRDAHVKKVTDQSKHEIAGTDWHCAPARDGNKIDDAAAKVGEGFLKKIENFDAAKFNLAEARFKGSAFAKIVGRRVNTDFGPDITGETVTRSWWVPTQLLDIDRRRFRWVPRKPGENGALVQEMSSIEKGQVVWKTLDHPEWLVQHVYDDSEATLGYGRGLIDAMYQSWYAKTRLRVELLQAAERIGQGLLVQEILPERMGSTAQDNDSILTAAAETLAKTKGRHALACFVGEKIAFVGGPQEGWQLLLAGLKYHDDEITGLVLGSVLPSGGNADAGSLARARVEQDTSDTVSRFHRRLLGNTLSMSVLGLCWRLNRANILAMGLGLAERPRLDLSHESRETPVEAADLLKKTVDAGLDVSQAEAYKRTGWSPPKPGEPVVQRAAPASPFGLPPSEAPGTTPDPKPEPEAAPAAFSADDVRKVVAEAMVDVLPPREPVKPHIDPAGEPPEVPEFSDWREARVWFAKRTYGLADDDPKVTGLRALVEAKFHAAS